MVSIYTDSYSRIPATSPVQDSTDLSIDQYSLEILGLLGYYDVLEKDGAVTNDPTWIQGQIQSCLTQLNAAIAGGSSKLDPQVWQILQQFQTNGAGYSDSWWTGILSNMPGGGSVASWITAHPDASWQGTDAKTTTSMNFSAILLEYDLTLHGQGTDFWGFHDQSRIHPFLPALTSAISDSLAEYFYVQAGSPAPGSAGWNQFAESLKCMPFLLVANNPPQGSPIFTVAQNLITVYADVFKGEMPPQLGSYSYDFSVIFSDYLAQ